MRKIRKAFIVGLMVSVILMISVFLTSFTNTALAHIHERPTSVFADDLVVGDVVSVYMGPTYDYQDALVIKEGVAPRLILLSNLGNTFYADDSFFLNEQVSTWYRGRWRGPHYVVLYIVGATKYGTSNLKKEIDARTAESAPYIFNFRAPTRWDVARNGDLIDPRIAQGGPFWTRSAAPTITTRWDYERPRIWREYDYYRWRMWFVNSNGAIEQTSLFECRNDSKPFRYPSNYRRHRWEVARSLGVRPVFNLRPNTMLKYDSEANVFRVTTDPADIHAAYLYRYGLLYQSIIDTKTATTNLETIITNNIEASDNMPPIVNLKTVSGARATSGDFIEAIVTVSDNRQGTFTYSINGGDTFSELPDDGIIELPVTNRPGNNVITVRVKDVAENIGSDTIVIRGLLP